jgi:hypothetical protein
MTGLSNYVLWAKIQNTRSGIFWPIPPGQKHTWTCLLSKELSYSGCLLLFLIPIVSCNTYSQHSHKFATCSWLDKYPYISLKDMKINVFLITFLPDEVGGGLINYLSWVQLFYILGTLIQATIIPSFITSSHQSISVAIPLPCKCSRCHGDLCICCICIKWLSLTSRAITLGY